MLAHKPVHHLIGVDLCICTSDFLSLAVIESVVSLLPSPPQRLPLTVHVRIHAFVFLSGLMPAEGETKHLTCTCDCRCSSLSGLTTGIRPTQITIASKLVKDFTGVMIQPHKVTFQLLPLLRLCNHSRV